VEFTASELVVTLMDGRRIATPLEWYPRLQRASAAERADYEIMTLGIHWPAIDEDLGHCRYAEGAPREVSVARTSEATSGLLRSCISLRLGRPHLLRRTVS
jgi:hypothetical protein